MTGRPRIGGVFPGDLARRGARELAALRVALALCAAVAVNVIVIHHTLADWEHVVAFGAGVATGTLADRSRS